MPTVTSTEAQKLLKTEGTDWVDGKSVTAGGRGVAVEWIYVFGFGALGWGWRLW